MKREPFAPSASTNEVRSSGSLPKRITMRTINYNSIRQTAVNVKGSNRPSYFELRNAYASMMQVYLEAYNWDWWVTLTSRNPMPLEVIKGRFFWWLRVLRKVVGHHVEVIWWAERQRRGALHIHAVIADVPVDDENLWKGIIHTWETYWTREGRFGDATIKRYDTDKAGKLSWYLAKERCKDLDVLEGSGFFFEKFGFSRGVKKYVENKLTEPIRVPSCSVSESCKDGP